jgi:outer membrane lipoprotein-sorting protein
MRKLSGWVVAMGLVVGLAAGCAPPSQRNVMAKLENEAQTLDSKNYHSTATMTVQMDNSSQTYYIETCYEGPDTYKIALGDQNKNINQIIVRNKNGMFIVSPALQKVFRFNGNWAQNQGHIYLYDQIIQQIVGGKDTVKVSHDNGVYSFTMPVTPANDVVVKERVDVDSSTMSPKMVVLMDKNGKAIVTINFTSFKTGVTYQVADFDPHKLVGVSNTQTKPTLAPADFEPIPPQDTLGDTLSTLQPQDQDSTLLRYTGDNSFVLEESRPAPGVEGLPETQLLDLYGIPALLAGSQAHQMVWVNNGVEFSLTSAHLTVEQLRQVALSTMGSSGK